MGKSAKITVRREGICYKVVAKCGDEVIDAAEHITRDGAEMAADWMEEGLIRQGYSVTVEIA